MTFEKLPVFYTVPGAEHGADPHAPREQSDPSTHSQAQTWALGLGVCDAPSSADPHRLLAWFVIVYVALATCKKFMQLLPGL